MARVFGWETDVSISARPHHCFNITKHFIPLGEGNMHKDGASPKAVKFSFRQGSLVANVSKCKVHLRIAGLGDLQKRLY